MKRNVLMIPFLAVMTLLVLSFAIASTYPGKNYISTEFNGVDLEEGSVYSIAAYPGETVPVRITFNSPVDAEDVRIEVYMDGKGGQGVETSSFDVIAGKSYTRLLSLKLPSDIKDLTKEYTLYVEITVAGDRVSSEYTVTMQRESYVSKILTVDYSSKVSAGDVFPISVVVKNNGYNVEDDVYVVASIPELGISTRGYLGDLVPQDSYAGDDGEEDSAEKIVYLRVPSDAPKGVYDLKVDVYNDDFKTSTTKLISIGSSESTMALASVRNKDVSAGETTTYDLVLVNSGSNVKVFNLEAVSGNVLGVSVPQIITVDAGSSKTVPVTVTVADDAALGAYTFSVNVDDQTVTFGANVVGSNVSNSVVALTVVLVIIFVVLLAVLVILLTRKEKPMEEVETSYY